MSAYRSRAASAASAWTLVDGLAHPKSRGRVQLTGADPNDSIHLDANTFGDPDDLKTAIAAVELCREIGNSALLSPFVSREAIPGNLKGRDLEAFVREAATSYWHSCGTAKMGRDSMSVVDSALRVYGIETLRVADGSVLPRITTGNSMAPCVVIGERAGDILRAQHRLGPWRSPVGTRLHITRSGHVTRLSRSESRHKVLASNLRWRKFGA